MGRKYFERVSFVVEIPERWYHMRTDMFTAMNELRMLAVHVTEQSGYREGCIELTYWFDKRSLNLTRAIPFMALIGLGVTHYEHRPEGAYKFFKSIVNTGVPL